MRAEGAVPATIAICEGRPTIGLNEDELRAARAKEAGAQGQPARSWPPPSPRSEPPRPPSPPPCCSPTRRASACSPPAASAARTATAIIPGTSPPISSSWRARRWPWSAPAPRASSTSRARWRFSRPRACRSSATAPTSFPRSTSILPASRSRRASTLHGKPLIYAVRIGAWAAAGVVLGPACGQALCPRAGTFMHALSTAEQAAMGIGVRGKELTPFLAGPPGGDYRGPNVKSKSCTCYRQCSPGRAGRRGRCGARSVLLKPESASKGFPSLCTSGFNREKPSCNAPSRILALSCSHFLSVPPKPAVTTRF